MKRLFALFLTLATAGLSYGQVAHWVLHPKYDEVKAYGNGMFRVLKDDGKYAISGGRQVYPPRHRVS